MLPRGEQRAMLLLSLLLIIGIVARVTVQFLPARDPPGMDKFVRASRKIMVAIAEADSIRDVREGLYSIEPEYKKVPSGRPQYNPSSQYRNRKSLSVAEPININTADSASLLPLPGIGPVFAGRIIKYRNLLGGFVRTEQLNEIYGLEMETAARIAPLLSVDSSDITKLKVNSASFRDLLRHPYLQMEDVKALVKYRDFNGGIGSLREIEANRLLPDSTLEKVSPYLEFNH